MAGTNRSLVAGGKDILRTLTLRMRKMEAWFEAGFVHCSIGCLSLCGQTRISHDLSYEFSPCPQIPLQMLIVDLISGALGLGEIFSGVRQIQKFRVPADIIP
jgi:hypothetical protein